MFTLELNQELEARLFDIARQKQQTLEQLIIQMLDHYLNRRESSNLLVDLAKDFPIIEAFAEKDPLSIQQEMRDEWRFSRSHAPRGNAEAPRRGEWQGSRA